MKYLYEQVEDKMIINKSEFIGILYPIENDEDISNAIADAKKRYPKANHYVTAWIKGVNGEYASSSDDGEPSKTAGYPALSVLMVHKLTNVLCVIVRYFGGIHLGAGGLIRAYRASAVIAVEAGKYYNKVLAKKYKITFAYNLIDTVEHLLKDNVDYVNKEYLNEVTYEIVFLNGTNLTLLENIIHQISEVIELDEEILKVTV